MEEFTPCGACNNGYVFEWDDNNSEWVASRCDCYDKWLTLQQKINGLRKAGLSPEISEYSIDDYKGQDQNDNIRRVKKFVENFNDRFRSVNLYFWSDENGTQKTTVAQWMVASLIDKGYKAKFVNMNDLVEKLMKHYFDGSYDDEIEAAKRTDFLVIDDAFDTSKVNLWKSGYQFSYIDTFFRVRLEQYQLATVFTSNIAPHGIGDFFTKSIGALINRNVIPFEFEDRIVGNEARTGVKRIENLDALFDD